MSDPEDNMNEMENGHIMEVVHIAGNESNDEDASSSSADSDEGNNLVDSNEEDDSDDDDHDNAAAQRAFDMDLPTTHKYLGKLDVVSGYTLFDEGEVLSVLGIHTNTFVFPGFILPLVMQNQSEHAAMVRFVETKNIFVLMCADETYSRLYDYGVTMEIFETTDRDGVLCLKARGRQRCKILASQETRNFTDRLQKLTVKILPEPKIGSPLDSTMLAALKLRRIDYDRSFDSMMRNYKYRRYHLAQYPLCSWVYDLNEASYFVKCIIKGLSRYYNEEHLPTDPIALSYWFVQNYQLTHEERLKIMKLDTAYERLRLELKYLNMERIICCAHCNAEIAEQNDVFAMSKDGLQSNYCNPNGHVFETVTIAKAKNFRLFGEASKQFSWFPGYAWTIMQCKSCNRHLGWQFTSKYLEPNCFYGMAKSGIDIKIVKRNSED